MAVRTSTGFENHSLDASFNGAAGDSFDSGFLDYYTGAQPTLANDAPTGTLVASVPVPADAFGAAATRAVAKAGTWTDTSANANGVIGWARLRESGDLGTTNTTDRRVDFACSMSGGGGDMILDNTNVAVGQPITVQTLSLSR